MTIKNVTIFGKEYPAMISTRTLIALEESGQTLAEALKAIASSPRQLIRMLMLMLDAGYQWRKEEGEEPDEIPSVDSIINKSTMQDLERLSSELIECVNASMERKVEVEEDRKNVTTTQTGK